MATVSFTPATPATHRDALVAINIEYLTWASAAMDAHFGRDSLAAPGITIAEYVPTALDAICGDPPPSGVFYLIERDGELAGMGGLRRGAPDVAEIKRVYVRPAHRGARLGAAVLERLIDDARAFGYRRIRLDTAPFMASAHRLYESLGFVDCPPHEGADVPAALRAEWRFMEKPL